MPLLFAIGICANADSRAPHHASFSLPNMDPECPGWRRLSGECGLCNHIYLTTPSEPLHRKRVVYGKKRAFLLLFFLFSSSSSSLPPPLLADSGIPEVFLSTDADNSFILDLGASIGTEEDPCGAHHGWFGWVSLLYFVSPRSWRDLGGRGGHSHRGNQTLIHFGGDSWSMISFFLWEREKKWFLNCKEKRTLKAWPLRLVPACSANPINSLRTEFKMMHWGLSSSRNEDADKPHNLQLGGLYGKEKRVSLLPVFCF